MQSTRERGYHAMEERKGERWAKSQPFQGGNHWFSGKNLEIFSQGRERTA